jgi:hypothetical protein
MTDLQGRRTPVELDDGLVDAAGHIVVVVDQVETVQPVQAQHAGDNFINRFWNNAFSASLIFPRKIQSF